MNTAEVVAVMLAAWISEGLHRAQIAVNLAVACLGWPYVFGAAGQYCTPATRRSYIKNYETRNPAEAEQIRKTCQVTNGSAEGCGKCKFYPGGKTRCYDCRGFTRWIIEQLGLSLQGAGATSQWNTNSNWTQKGVIADIPKDMVCCVFMQEKDGKTMGHTGLYIGNGEIIHCSGIVKRGKVTDKGWTHYAIPVGVNDDSPIPVEKPTIRRGSRGVYVTLAQTELINKGYSCGAKGADGIFGKDTEEAVKAFQRDNVDESGNPLKVDGVVGQSTWWALESQEVTRYTVTVPHLTLSQADELIAKYPGSEKKQEGG